MIKLPTIEEMLKAGLHFGHKTYKWHPKMKPYIYNSRNNIYIINIEKTRELLGKALEFIDKLAKENGTILFVGIKPQAEKIISKYAQELKMPYVVNKWIGGTLTNYAVIKKMIKKFKDLKEKEETGKLKKYTKKEQIKFAKEIEKLKKTIGGISIMEKLPQALFIWDVKKGKIALSEANKKKIPVIAVVDTNCNPENIDYPIPANDDTTKGLELIMGLIKKTIQDAK